MSDTPDWQERIIRRIYGTDAEMLAVRLEARLAKFEQAFAAAKKGSAK